MFVPHALLVWKLITNYEARTQRNLAILPCGFRVNVFVLIAILSSWISLPFPRKRRKPEAGRSQRPNKRSDPLLTDDQFVFPK